MTTQNVIAFRTPLQAAIFQEVLVPELTKGHWANATPRNHAEPWKDADVIVDEKKVGVGFEPIKANYDLLNKDMVDSIDEKKLKKLQKQVGIDDLTRKDLRRELREMMFIMRTPIGKPLATSNQGLIGRPGRPSREMLEALKRPKPAAPSKSRTAARRTKAN